MPALSTPLELLGVSGALIVVVHLFRVFLTKVPEGFTVHVTIFDSYCDYLFYLHPVYRTCSSLT